MINSMVNAEPPASSAERLAPLLEKARRVAEVARAAAAAVDRDARFPGEAFSALREEKLLAAAIPVELGGLGCSLSDLSEICTVLGGPAPPPA